MNDLDDFGKAMEQEFGLISGYFLFELHQVSTAAGSRWEYENPLTMEIIVNKSNAEWVYGLCREIRSGYSIGMSRDAIKKVKAARLEAHKYLYEEANDPSTSIERKIHLVKLTGKGKL